MEKAEKARHAEEIKIYIPPKEETKKKFKDPNVPKRPPSAFSWFCSEYCPKIKGEHPGLFTGEAAKRLGEMWTNTAADAKQPCEKKAAQLEGKSKKSIAACQAKGKPDAATHLSGFNARVLADSPPACSAAASRRSARLPLPRGSVGASGRRARGRSRGAPARRPLPAPCSLAPDPVRAARGRRPDSQRADRRTARSAASERARPAGS
ncbi:hypothetical protein AB1E18_003716 [Capra hircus]